MKVFLAVMCNNILIDQIQCILVLQEIFKGKSVHLLSKYFVCKHIKGPYADHILIPPGSTGSSLFFGFKWKPIFF